MRGSSSRANFSFEHVVPREYFVSAVGGAGSHLAIWQSTEEVKAAQKVMLKLASPVADCPTVY
jgi:hypothetical protein